MLFSSFTWAIIHRSGDQADGQADSSSVMDVKSDVIGGLKVSKFLCNPFDINRGHLIDQVINWYSILILFFYASLQLQLAKMRSYYLNPVQNENLGNEDLKHSVSIAEMGDYQVALRSRVVRWIILIQVLLRDLQSLRPLYDDEEETTPLFGNPFRKLAKNKDAIRVDEAEFEDASENKVPHSSRNSISIDLSSVYSAGEACQNRSKSCR